MRASDDRMPKRKEMKRRAKRALKRHYIMYVAVCLIAACIGAEFSSSLNILKISPVSAYQSEETRTRPAGDEEGLADLAAEVVKRGDMPAVKEWKRLLSIPEQGADVLAAVVNDVTAGSLAVNMLAAQYALSDAEDWLSILLILAGTAVVFCVWFFFTNIFTVISRRVFLEGRLYEKVHFQRLLFLLRVKKWTRVCCTMFLVSFYQFLWSLTIVGGIIKYYSYYLVPYIAAENPDISPRDAITLSREMMKGHKWECFVFELSFLLWNILEVATLGISAILYSNAYKAAAFSEYYADLRQLVKKKHLRGSEKLNDIYLYELPEEEMIYLAYEDVISALIRRPKDILKLTRIRRFFADYLGVLFLHTKREDEYERMKARQTRMELLKDAVERKAYPSRLSAVPETEKREQIEAIRYMRYYSVWSLILLFFLFSIIGWVWEISLCLVTEGTFINRGVLHGPWLPICGGSAVLILTLLNRLRRKPVQEFIAAMILFGCIEYGSSLLLERIHDGKRWWDYTGYLLNLHGRISAQGLIVFGIEGVAIVYMLAPLIDNQIRRMKHWMQIILCLLLMIAFLADCVYSAGSPNSGRGITTYEEKDACLQFTYPPCTYL